MANAGCPPKTDLISAPAPRLRPASSKTTAAAWSLSQSRPQHSKLRSPSFNFSSARHNGHTSVERLNRGNFTSVLPALCALVSLRLVVRSYFILTPNRQKVCNLHGAQRPLIKRCSMASSDTDVTGDSKKSRSRPWAATHLNSPNHLYPSEN